MRILIVDDEAPTRRLLERHLRASSRVTEVAHAAAAEEAAAIVESRGFEVLLVDLVLGVQDGREMLAPLRLAAPDALLVALTALPADIAELSALEAGADLFLEKSSELYPMLADVLFDAVQRQGAS